MRYPTVLPLVSPLLGNVLLSHRYWGKAQIDKDGIIVRDAKGNPVPHPALAIEKAAQVEVRAWSERFKPRRRQ